MQNFTDALTLEVLIMLREETEQSLLSTKLNYVLDPAAASNTDL